MESKFSPFDEIVMPDVINDSDVEDSDDGLLLDQHVDICNPPNVWQATQQYALDVEPQALLVLKISNKLSLKMRNFEVIRMCFSKCKA